MAEIINGYVVTSSNASKKGSQMASVSVKSPQGVLLARIYSERSQPLRFLRKWPHSNEAAQLIDQLARSGTPKEVIDAILSL